MTDNPGQNVGLFSQAFLVNKPWTFSFSILISTLVNNHFSTKYISYLDVKPCCEVLITIQKQIKNGKYQLGQQLYKRFGVE